MSIALWLGGAIPARRRGRVWLALAAAFDPSTELESRPEPLLGGVPVQEVADDDIRILIPAVAPVQV